MTAMRIPRDEKLSLPTRMRMLVALLVLSWAAIYGVYWLITRVMR